MAGKVLVTGGTGFIGVPLVARLASEGYDVLALGSADGDIGTLDIEAHLKGAPVERVIHLAGKTFVPASWTEPLSFYQTNVLGTANVADYCRKVGAALTYVSAYVYGIPASLPIHEASNAQPNNPYAQSKFLGEQVCQHYSSSFSVPVTILRPFNIYGKGQARSFLIPKIIEQALQSEVIELDSLLPRRDYIYIDDLVEAIVMSLQAEDKTGVYNLGSGYSVSVEDIINVIQSCAGTSKRVVSRNLTRENEVMDVVADISKFSSAFNWQPKFRMQDGINDMLSAWS